MLETGKSHRCEHLVYTTTREAATVTSLHSFVHLTTQISQDSFDRMETRDLSVSISYLNYLIEVRYSLDDSLTDTDGSEAARIQMEGMQPVLLCLNHALHVSCDLQGQSLELVAS